MNEIEGSNNTFSTTLDPKPEKLTSNQPKNPGRRRIITESPKMLLAATRLFHANPSEETMLAHFGRLDSRKAEEETSAEKFVKILKTEFPNEYNKFYTTGKIEELHSLNCSGFAR